MKIKKYKVTVTTDFIHGWKSKILEYWIPPVRKQHKGIVFNFHGDNETNLMNCWFNNKPRYHIHTEIEIEDRTAQTIYEYLKARQKLNLLKQVRKIGTDSEMEEKEITRKQMKEQLATFSKSTKVQTT